VKEIPVAVEDCKCAYSDVAILLAASKTMESPWSFFYHVGKDIVINRV